WKWSNKDGIAAYRLWWQSKKKDKEEWNAAGEIPVVYLPCFYKEFSPEDQEKYAEYADDQIPPGPIAGFPLFDFRVKAKWKEMKEKREKAKQTGKPVTSTASSSTPAEPSGPATSSTAASLAVLAAENMPDDCVFIPKAKELEILVRTNFSHFSQK